MRQKLNNKQLTILEFRLLIVIVFIIGMVVGSLTIFKFSVGNHFYVSTNIKGESMYKTLTEESKILCISHKIKKIKRGNIVNAKAYINGEPVIRENDDHFIMVKRVIGLPNETITIKGKDVYINGELLEEPYAYYESNSHSDDDITVILEEGEYFLMGDNRMNSLDSRFFDISNIESILGVVLVIR